MYNLLVAHNLWDIPVVSSELKFLIILAIVLLAPLVLDRFRIPHILGLIIAGAIIGEHGLNLLERDSGIVMSGTAGLLYIMFLAGLEIDINEFVKNRWRSFIFGLYTFSIPMALGTLVGIHILHLSLMTSLLLASMFASHTLLAYPIISKMGVKRNRAVTVTIGGTVIAETLALLVLAVIVGIEDHGGIDPKFWLVMTAKLLAFGFTIFYIFPIAARTILKRCKDGVTQYIFVLFMLFLAAILAMAAGVEGIIGALFAGLALNRLIPPASTLMNRIEFVGNAIFIPFFLIGVGMLIDYRVFISDLHTLYTAFIMTIVAILTKYIAAYITQKSFGYNSAERSVIFGLSSARAAATLAVVLVGYRVGLFDDAILNGTIVMIFITCSVASITAQRGAHKIAMDEAISLEEEDEEEDPQRILLPFNSMDSIGEMVQFTTLISPTKIPVTVASIISDAKEERTQVAQAKRIFERSLQCASSSDRNIETLLRYDVSYSHGISNIIRENNVSDLVINVDSNRVFTPKMVAKIIDSSAHNSSVTTLLYRSYQPINTITRHRIVIPPHAEAEIGFRAWIIRVWTLLHATGASATIYATKASFDVIESINKAAPLPIQLEEYERYRDMLIIARDMQRNDGLIFVLSRKDNPSYDANMENIPHYLNNYFSSHNFILIYPYQNSSVDGGMDGLTNTASISAVAKIEDIIDSVIRVFKG